MAIRRSLLAHLPRFRGTAPLLVLAVASALLVAIPARPAAAATCPCSIFSATQTPGNPSENDTDPVELGVKFRADTDGAITAIRFYKGTGNGGAHTGSLWDSAGKQLSTVAFTGETTTGWQQANLPSPIAVTAGTTYVASYYAPVGRYAADAGAFANAGSRQQPADRVAERHGRRQRRLSLRGGRRISHQHLSEQQLLGRCGVHHQRGRHHEADRNRSSARRRSDERPGRRPACPRPSASRCSRRPCPGREQCGRCGRRDVELRRRHANADLHAHRQPGHLDHLHRESERDQGHRRERRWTR